MEWMLQVKIGGLKQAYYGHIGLLLFLMNLVTSL